MIAAIDVGAAIDGQRRNPLRTIVVVLGVLVMFLDGYDLNLLGYVAPALMHEFGVGKAEFAAPLIVSGASIALLGRAIKQSADPAKIGQAAMRPAR